MDHITELIVEEVQIKGGRQIKTAAYKTPNRALFHSLFYIGKALRWLMEVRSNNMSAGMQPRDIRKFWQLWHVHKKDLEISQKFSDAPAPVLEFSRVILLPHPSEMRRYKNMKIQRVASELHEYAHVCMSIDSAEGTDIVRMADYADILEAQSEVEEKLLWLMGTGNKTKDGEWDTGIEMPALLELGTEIPDGDLDELSFAEASFSAAASGLPDAKDESPGQPT